MILCRTRSRADDEFRFCEAWRCQDHDQAHHQPDHVAAPSKSHHQQPWTERKSSTPAPIGMRVIGDKGVQGGHDWNSCVDQVISRRHITQQSNGRNSQKSSRKSRFFRNSWISERNGRIRPDLEYTPLGYPKLDRWRFGDELERGLLDLLGTQSIYCKSLIEISRRLHNLFSGCCRETPDLS